MSRSVTQMTIWDADHISPEMREEIIASYPEHERKARIRGIPALGSGAVYPIDEEEITVDPFDIPGTFALLGAIDFGGPGADGHPTAAVKLAHDRDTDIIYLMSTYRKKGGTTLIHSGALKPWGRMPWAWPHDGFRKIETQSGRSAIAVKDMYAGHGLNMLDHNAQFEDGSTGVEAGVIEILERMQTGRFKVFSNNVLWFQELRNYHRKDGVIVKEFDDLMDATRYGIMEIRNAETDQAKSWGRPNRKGII